MALSGVINGSQDSKGYYLRLSWTVTAQNQATNESTVSITLRLIATKTGYYFTNYGITNGIKANNVQWGSQQNKQYSIANPSSGPTGVDLYTYSRTTTHNADGTKSLSLNGYASVNSPASFTFSSLSVNGTAVLDTITPPITKYSVTFNDDNTSNSDPAALSIDSGSTFTFPSAGSKTGYYYYWYLNGSGSAYVEGQTSPAVTSPQNWIASWFANTYQLSYDANGGSVSPSSKFVTYNSSIGSLPTPSRSGYSFLGWYTSPSGGSQVTSSTTYTTAGNSTIYARWQANPPGWTDQTVSSPITIDKNISAYSDSTVSASGATSYTIYHLSGPQPTTNWLSINDSGQLSGSTNIVGTYTFYVTATNPSGSVNSSNITISVIYPGKRISSSLSPASFEAARRYVGPFTQTTNANGANVTADSSGFVSLTRMKRWNGSSWVAIEN
jgi:uncharacterized repeat protein (TIGR02543 family)